MFQVPCQKKTGSVGRLYFFSFFFTFFFFANSTKQFFLSSPKSTGNVIRLWILVICTLADVVVLDLCTLALQTLDCRVLSGDNNRNKFILFLRQRRPEYIKCKVTLLYHYDDIEIKASSCFHNFFFSKAIACTITLIFNM